MAAVLTAPAKVQLLQHYRDEYDLRVLVETGLYFGHGSGMVVRGVDQYVAVDVQEENIRLARERGHTAVHGDSATVLPEVLRAFDEPVLFWLDAHAIDGDPDEWPPCPLRAELDAISAHRDEHELEHVVLVDDISQLPGGTRPPLLRDAPTAAELRAWASGHGWKVWEADDVLRLTP